jgi:hypothetical protein
MASTILNSPKAVQVSVLVVRAFVRLRQFLASHQQLATKLNELEAKLHKHDHQILALIDAIRQLMSQPEPERRPPIGFQTEGRRSKPPSQKHSAKGRIDSRPQ